MAMTALSVQNIVRSGLTPSFSAANADGHSVVNDGKKTFVEVKNAGGSSITLTIKTPGTVDGLEVTDRTVTVGATTGDKMIGPFPVEDYGASVEITFSAVTSVTCAAFKLP
jgi:hypothetical protein